MPARPRPPPAPRLPHGPAHGQNLIPQHVYAPYFETWTKANIPATARKSGAHYLTLAFLQTPKKGSCTVAWDGNPRQVVKPGGRYVHQVRELRAMGGHVVPSFGGFSADQGGTEIADSCPSVPKIAQAYENVVTTYGVTRLDMDVEANSLTNKAGIARRSEALALLQQWAARTHRTVQIVFTIGVEPWGLPGNCFNVIQSAAAHGVRFTVNIMAFDYYIKASETGIEMGKAAIKALNGTHAQLAQLYPQPQPAQALVNRRHNDPPGDRRLPEEDRGHLPARRAGDCQLRAVPRDAGAFHLGDPAGQRRLPGRHRQQLLLRDQAVHLGVQPRLRRLHRLARPGADRCGVRALTRA